MKYDQEVTLFTVIKKDHQVLSDIINKLDRDKDQNFFWY